jgi:nucleotide-binding universal stress UspA family protein
MYLLRNTRVGHVSILYDAVDMPDPTAHIDRKNVRHDIRLHPMDGRLTDTVKTLCRKDQIGLVVMRPLGRSFLKSISRPETIALAHELACPLLIARNSNPYDRILVPFNGTAMAALALETAVGLAEQIGALVDAAVVQEPDFIHGESRESWSDKTFKKVREISHIHKVKIGEIECRGNPVKEITALAERYQLMVVGSTNPQKELLTPHVGELLVERTPCSVLILASGAP